MTQIDFYILQENASAARWHFACRLVEKAFRHGHNILITLDEDTDINAFDELLWSFKPESFIPHRILSPTGSAAGAERVLISNHSPDQNPFIREHSLLINLARNIPAAFSDFERLIEIVIQEENVLKNTREHYHFYRKGGYSIEHRKI